VPSFESPALPRNEAAFGVIKDVRSRFGACPILPSIHSFPFEHPNGTLGRALSAQLPTALMPQIT
jgi:hypothetical protein